MTGALGTSGRALKVLVIDRTPPCDLTQGSSLIAHHVFARLGHHELTLVCPSVRPLEAHERQALDERFARIVLVPRARVVPALSGWVEGRLAGSSGTRLGPLDLRGAARLRATLDALLAAGSYDIVHTRTLTMSAYAMRIPRVPRLLELGDSTALGARRAYRRGWRAALRARVAARVEATSLPRFDVVTSVANADAEEMRRSAPTADVRVIPTGVDGDYFRPMDVDREAATVAFVGAMSYPPNVAAVQYFVRDILPLVRRRRPDARFVIIGRDPSPDVSALAVDPAVEVTGLVPDVRPYLAAATAVVVPMVSGSGIKNKVMEAFAMARPVIATPLGVEGVGAVHDVHALIATDPGAFAQEILRVFDEPSTAERLARAGRAMVEERYTWDACARRYDDLYRQLAARRAADA